MWFRVSLFGVEAESGVGLHGWSVGETRWRVSPLAGKRGANADGRGDDFSLLRLPAFEFFNEET